MFAHYHDYHSLCYLSAKDHTSILLPYTLNTKCLNMQILVYSQFNHQNMSTCVNTQQPIVIFKLFINSNSSWYTRYSLKDKFEGSEPINERELLNYCGKLYLPLWSLGFLTDNDKDCDYLLYNHLYDDTLLITLFDPGLYYLGYDKVSHVTTPGYHRAQGGSSPAPVISDNRKYG